MRANRIDSNQPEIVKQFRDWACSVLIIADLKNCCDLIVSKHGRSIFVEIKDGKKPKSARKLTEGEEKFKAETQGAWRLCENEKDAQSIINELNSTLAIPLRWEK